jgi:hypothetical protein
MSSNALAKLTELQGRMVGVALSGGRRIDECQLIALPLRNIEKFWLWTGGEDVFVTPDQVLAVWETRSSVAR